MHRKKKFILIIFFSVFRRSNPEEQNKKRNWGHPERQNATQSGKYGDIEERNSFMHTSSVLLSKKSSATNIFALSPPKGGKCSERT